MKQTYLSLRFTTCLAAALFAMQSIPAAPLMASQSYQTSTISTIAWTSDYESALSRAKSENKPILLFFTGSDWCTWCHRLEQEVFDTAQFSESAKDQYIFVKLDFPKRSPIDPALKQQNDTLQNHYNISSYPTIVLIDSEEKVIAKTGYKAGGAESYASHLSDLSGIKVAKVESFDSLKSKYAQLKGKGSQEEIASLLEKGVNMDQNDYFAKEQFQFLAKNGGLFEPYTRLLKERLLKNDPNNALLNHYIVAVAEFDAKVVELENNRIDALSAVQPLADYLERFGSSDRQNSWRIEATIAEVFYDQSQFSDALKWATLARDHAPQDFKDGLEKRVATIESDLKTKSEIAQNN